MSDTNHEIPDYTADEIEFLRKFTEENRKAITHRRIIAYAELAILGLLIISFFIIVPRLTSLMNSMNDTLDRINRMSDQIEPVVTEMGDAMNGLENVVTGLGELDYQSLNESVNKLNGAVDNLSQFTSRLNSITSIFGRN